MRVPTDNFYSQQLNMLSDQYENLNRLYLLQTKKTKILDASDDPVLASRIQSTKDFIADLTSYSQNQIIGKNRTQLFESSITQAVNSVKNVRSLLIQAANDTYSDDDRAHLATQLEGELRNILSAANTRDSDGQYIYSGYNSSTPPFTQQGSTYQYQGGYNSTDINIGPNTSLLYNESGFDVFGNIALGNGSFTVNAGAGNTGSASTSAGNITNSATYVPDTYTISFVTNASGKVGYQVIGASSGQVIPAPPATLPANAPDYVDGDSIAFNGLTLKMSGPPNVGDTFTIAPSARQNVFDSLQNIINILKTPVTSGGIIDKTKQALLHQNLAQSEAGFEQVFNQFSGYLGAVGVREQIVNSEKTIDDNLITNQTAILSELQDAILPELASKINQQLVTLQATQDTYLQIQKTLLDLLKV